MRRIRVPPFKTESKTCESSSNTGLQSYRRGQENVIPKGLTGQPCTYCETGVSTAQGDHVFPRTLFLESRRDDLPKVPACKRCNDEKSRLEHYLTTVLPFGGRHADASVNLEEQVPGRLARNQRLHRELAAGRETIEVAGADGPRTGATAIPFEPQMLFKFTEFVVRGLLWHHWKTRLRPNCGVRVIIPTNAVADTFLQSFSHNARQRVSVDLGEGTIRYEGAQGNYPELSVWAMSLYGGVVLSGQSQDPDDQSALLYAMTGANEFLRRPAIVAVFGDTATDIPPTTGDPEV